LFTILHLLCTPSIEQINNCFSQSINHHSLLELSSNSSKLLQSYISILKSTHTWQPPTHMKCCWALTICVAILQRFFMLITNTCVSVVYDPCNATNSNGYQIRLSRCYQRLYGYSAMYLCVAEEGRGGGVPVVVTFPLHVYLYKNYNLCRVRRRGNEVWHCRTHDCCHTVWTQEDN
jgi:hypothetical protein